MTASNSPGSAALGRRWVVSSPLDARCFVTFVIGNVVTTVHQRGRNSGIYVTGLWPRIAILARLVSGVVKSRVRGRAGSLRTDTGFHSDQARRARLGSGRRNEQGNP